MRYLMSFPEPIVADDAIMTLAEVAQFLKVGERTILKMVHCDEIPAMRIGNQWRFMRSNIDIWLNSKSQAAPHNDLTRLIETDDTSVPLSRLVDPRYINLALHPGTTAEVLTQLTSSFVEAGDIDADGQKTLVEGLVYRENILSTALEEGVAFPHLRTPSDNPLPGPVINVGRCDSGTDFGSRSGGPTYVFFFICTNSILVHLRIIARLARAVSDFDLVKRLMDTKTSRAVLAVFLGIGI
jgi:nitrogen PTS system EIIA component